MFHDLGVDLNEGNVVSQVGGVSFQQFDERGVETRVYEELLRSSDEGVAEFLDLERVRANTLGNTRMVLFL